MTTRRPPWAGKSSKLDETLEGRLRAIFARVLGCEEEDVTLNASLVDDLAADDLDLVELTMEIEHSLSIVIPDDYDLEELRNFEDWVRICENPPKEVPDQVAAMRVWLEAQEQVDKST